MQQTSLGGIAQLDSLCSTAFPAGRVTALVGGAGSGKSIFGLQSLCDGKPAVVVAFEENAADIKAQMKAFGWPTKQLTIIDARLPHSVVHGGDFDVTALLQGVGAAMARSNARRVLFDGIDVLLGSLSDVALIRREVFRLREWVEEKKVTALVTSKVDDATGARLDGLLQYLAHVVIQLDHRLDDGIAVRTLRISKFRGSAHSANETPFVIGDRGIEIVGGSQRTLDHPAPNERVSSGVPALDAMLAGGYHRASSVLITGSPGTSKTNLAAAFAAAACRRKEKTLYVSFDEAPAQIVRNVASVGTELAPFLKSGLLSIVSFRGRGDSPDAHVVRIRRHLDEHGAQNLVIDPVSALATEPSNPGAPAALRLIDVAKKRGVTAVYASLLSSSSPLSEETLTGISTIADTWMHVSYVDRGGERNRALSIVKSRGTRHSNQVRELVLDDSGITLADVYALDGQLLMGTMRWEREQAEARNKAESAERAAREEDAMRVRSAEVEAKLAALNVEREAIQRSLGAASQQQKAREALDDAVLAERKRMRRGDKVRSGIRSGSSAKR